MMTELQTFYSEHAKLHDPEAAKVYESLASNIPREGRDFKHAPADVAVPEPHHAGLTGHGMLIESCTSPDSMMGKVGKDLGVQVIRRTETHMNVEHCATMDIFTKMIESNPSVDLSGSLPCGLWSQWQSLDLCQYGASVAERLDEQQAKSRELLKRFCCLAKIAIRNGGRVTYEWPRHCAEWALQELQGLIQDCGMMLIDFEGCRVGLHDGSGELHLKKCHHMWPRCKNLLKA